LVFLFITIIIVICFFYLALPYRLPKVHTGPLFFPLFFSFSLLLVPLTAAVVRCSPPICSQSIRPRRSSHSYTQLTHTPLLHALTNGLQPPVSKKPSAQQQTDEKKPPAPPFQPISTLLSIRSITCPKSSSAPLPLPFRYLPPFHSLPTPSHPFPEKHQAHKYIHPYPPNTTHTPSQHPPTSPPSTTTDTQTHTSPPSPFHHNPPLRIRTHPSSPLRVNTHITLSSEPVSALLPHHHNFHPSPPTLHTPN